MKHTLCFITILLGSLLNLYANNENDSLLKVLDKVISERLVYTEKKEATLMRILRSLRNWIIKPICWKEGCNWLLFIPYRGCLFKLMIFSNQSIVRIYQVIYRLCIVGIAFGIMKT